MHKVTFIKRFTTGTLKGLVFADHVNLASKRNVSAFMALAGKPLKGCLGSSYVIERPQLVA